MAVEPTKTLVPIAENRMENNEERMTEEIIENSQPEIDERETNNAEEIQRETNAENYQANRSKKF